MGNEACAEDDEGFKIARGKRTFKPKMVVNEEEKKVKTMINQWEGLAGEWYQKPAKEFGRSPRIDHA